MIAIRARIVETESLGQAIDPETGGLGPVQLFPRLTPEGLEERFDWVPTEEPVKGAEQVVFCPPDAVPEDDPRLLGPDDVPIRDDLPATHPLRGKRALRVVPAGMPDCTVADGGRLAPLDLKTGLPVGSAEPGELGEVERGGP